MIAWFSVKARPDKKNEDKALSEQIRGVLMTAGAKGK